MSFGIKIDGNMPQGADALTFRFGLNGKIALGWIALSALELLRKNEEESGEMIFLNNIERIEQIISARVAEGRSDFDICEMDLAA